MVRCHTEGFGLVPVAARHTVGPRRPAAASRVVTSMTPGSAVCACPGAAVWVWLHVCLRLCFGICVCVSVTIAVRAACVWGWCVCLSGFSALQEPLWCVGGRRPGLPSGKLDFVLIACPPPLDAIRDCFHPPSTASGTLNFAPVAPTEALSSLLSLGPLSSRPPPVAVSGVHMGCGAGPRGAPPFCHRDCLGSAPSQL